MDDITLDPLADELAEQALRELGEPLPDALDAFLDLCDCADDGPWHHLLREMVPYEGAPIHDEFPI